MEGVSVLVKGVLQPPLFLCAESSAMATWSWEGRRESIDVAIRTSFLQGAETFIRTQAFNNVQRVDLLLKCP